MVADNGFFRISSLMIDYLHSYKLALMDQRFILAAIHFQHLLGDWPTTDWEVAHRAQWIPLDAFRQLGCAPKANDTRHFQATTDFWVHEGLLFDYIGLTADRRNLEWRFSAFAFEIMSNMSRYALFNTDGLKLVETDMDLDILLQVSLHYRMQRPQFRFFHEIDSTGSPTVFTLRANDRKLQDTLKRLAARTGYTFVIGYHQGGDAPGYTEAIVRIQHRRTAWKGKQIRKFPPRTKVVAISPKT